METVVKYGKPLGLEGFSKLSTGMCSQETNGQKIMGAKWKMVIIFMLLMFYMLWRNARSLVENRQRDLWIFQIKTGVNMCTRDMAESRRVNVISELSCVMLEVWISTGRFSVTKIYKYFSSWI